MVLNFSWLPPEINSARIFAGAGSGSLFTAASAWDGLASDLSASASSFQSVLSGLANGAWTGPASLSMAAAAAPYVTWLSAAAGQAAAAASQARTAATAFESALAGTVPLPLVTANRSSLTSLVDTNFLGQNTPAIFATEFDYVEMWAQDVGAMLGYHAGAATVASALPAFSLPSLSLSGLQGLVSSAASGVATAVSTAAVPVVDGAEGAATGVASLASELPLSSLTSVAQIGMYPVSMLMSPLMMLAQSAQGGAGAAQAGAAAAGLVSADVPKVGAEAMKGLGGLGGGMSAGLGQARLVGAMSVPPTWQGSTPAHMGSAAMSGLGGAGVPNAAAMAGAQGTGGGMPMMPMPMGGGGMGAGAGGPLGRGGASPHVVQNRPSVVPRIGV
jgi:PPE-repeat protein